MLSITRLGSALGSRVATVTASSFQSSRRCFSRKTGNELIYPNRTSSPQITEHSVNAGSTRETHREKGDMLPPPSTSVSLPAITLEPLFKIDHKGNNELTEVQITDVDGIKVGSLEKSGGMSTIGVCVGAGSKWEGEGTRGINQAMELMCLKGNQEMGSTEIVERLDSLGSQIFALSSRDNYTMSVDCLRDNLDPAFKLWKNCLLDGVYSDEEVEECKDIMGWINTEMMGQDRLKEGIMGAAYGSSPLGNTHFVGDERQVSQITGARIREWREKFFTRGNMFIGGAGIEHAKLVDLVGEHFKDVKEGGPVECAKSEYVGGEFRLQEQNSIDGLTRVAVAFEVGGWHDDDMVAICVLQTLLGGGDSFSAGGPGKGMYSRLYREVLNRCYWAEAAEAFIMLHNDAGIIGISGASVPSMSQNLTFQILEQFAKLSYQNVTDEELSRAKNMLRCNVLTQLESRQILAEDLVRQFQTYGERLDPAVICEKIDAVTKDDLRRIVQKGMSKPPSISCVGPDLDKCPLFEQIAHIRGKDDLL
ncbi:hypothetical protein TrVE_jg3501 [Triparma verrucosa]|uniref:Mitochondrial processing peptidase n=1 Tax=Triparma verrucosa TaxID=1606542 RepID=A0A9W7EK17_9STRA|nr:hypothetical protein TrVE_jg3501 [Triparma verrucosa]